MPLKTFRVEELMYVKSVVTQSPHVNMVWKLEVCSEVPQLRYLLLLAVVQNYEVSITSSPRVDLRAKLISTHSLNCQFEDVLT
ncbi:hypothetical protein TNCV_3959081 [Trichonephila clavipes]|nr:hypothetical protein TNCV_3959081 [Trichonephila clavipes]